MRNYRDVGHHPNYHSYQDCPPNSFESIFMALTNVTALLEPCKYL
jgi:hypothetical protein